MDEKSENLEESYLVKMMDSPKNKKTAIHLIDSINGFIKICEGKSDSELKIIGKMIGIDGINDYLESAINVRNTLNQLIQNQ